jgi:hypothetical protein
MNDLLLMGSALYQYFNTNGTATVYYQKAPQGASVPYTVIQFMTAVDEYTFNDKGVSSDYAIKVVSDRKFPFDAIQLYGYIHSLIQDGSVSVAGYNVLRIRRESMFQYQDPQDFWNVGGIYNLDIWEI